MKTTIKICLATFLLFQLISCSKENNSCVGEESIRWFVNDETHDKDFNVVHAIVADDRMLYILAQRLENRSEPELIIQYDMIEQSASYSAKAFTNDGDFIFSAGTDLDMSVSSFSAAGDLICLNFDNGEFSGELQVVLDRMVKSAKVEGRVWLDENNNGLQDANENGLANVELYLRTGAAYDQLVIQYATPHYFPGVTGRTNDAGEFSFDGVFVDHPIRVTFSTEGEPILSVADVGNDDTIDSDFYLGGESLDIKWYHTDAFFIAEGDTERHIGLGIVQE